jgi:hypothetical protein
VVLVSRLCAALERLNPAPPPEAIPPQFHQKRCFHRAVKYSNRMKLVIAYFH